MNNYGMPQVAPNVFVKGGRFPSGGETYASPMNAGMAALPIPLFDLPLATTIVPRNSVAVPSFSRNSIATFDDWESKVRTVLANEVRFQGARRVQNFCARTETNLVGSGVWQLAGTGTGSIPILTENFAIAPDGTLTAHRIQCALNGGNNNVANQSYLGLQTTVTATRPRQSVWLKTNDGSTKVITLRGSAYIPAENAITITGIWQRMTCSVNTAALVAAANGIVIGVRGDATQTCSDSADILFWHPQIEETVGQSNTNPSEYISAGVLAVPYHGANVDGVKYFDVTNPNIVTGSVVTVSTAAPTAISGCQYWVESQKTNQCIRSEDFGAAAWSKNAATATILAGTAPDGNVTANKIAEDATVGVEHFVEQSGVTGTDSTTASFFVWAKAVERSWLRLCVVQRDAATVIGVFFNLTTGVVGTASGGSVGSIVAYPNGLYLCKVSAPVGTGATNPRIRMSLSPDGATLVYNGVAGSGILLWGAQFEDNVSFSSKYIPTLAAPVIRLIDGLTYPNAGSMNATQGTCYAEAQTEWSLNEASVWLVGTDGSGRLLFISGPGSNPTGISSKDAGAGSATGGGASMFGVTRRCGSSWSGTVSKSYYEGLAVSTGVNTGAMSLLTNIGIGCQGGGGSNGWSGGIKNVKIWDRDLTSTQMQGMVGSI